VEKKGDDQMDRREWGRTCRNKQVSLSTKRDLCVHIRFFCRLHRGCSGRGLRML
jgi:hypothetical protein